MGSRTAEFVMGLIGGIFGFLAAIVATVLGGLAASLGEAFESDEASSSGSFFIALGVSAIIFSIIGIAGAALVKGKPKLGGTLMIVSAIGGLISISLFYSLSFILLLIAGLMGVLKKEATK
jgi:chromate transport protein ChrA